MLPLLLLLAAAPPATEAAAPPVHVEQDAARRPVYRAGEIAPRDADLLKLHLRQLADAGREDRYRTFLTASVKAVAGVLVLATVGRARSPRDVIAVGGGLLAYGGLQAGFKLSPSTPENFSMYLDRSDLTTDAARAANVGAGERRFAELADDSRTERLLIAAGTMLLGAVVTGLSSRGYVLAGGSDQRIAAVGGIVGGLSIVTDGAGGLLSPSDTERQFELYTREIELARRAPPADPR